MDQTWLTSFLGWASVYHIVFLFLCAILLIPFKDPFSRLHAWLFGIDPERVKEWYFGFLAVYEALMILFFVVPYLVLRLAM